MPTSQIYLAETTLSNAQVLALPTTAVELVAAVPGAVIYPLFAHARTVWVANYTNIDAASNIHIVIGANSETLIPLRESIGSQVSALLAGGGPDGTHAFFQPRFLTAAGDFSSLGNFYDSDVVNLPMSISLDNALSGNLTGGDAGNSLIIQTVYMILST